MNFSMLRNITEEDEISNHSNTEFDEVHTQKQNNQKNKKYGDAYQSNNSNVLLCVFQVSVKNFLPNCQSFYFW